MLFTKNYKNQFMLVETIACQSWLFFLKHCVHSYFGFKLNLPLVLRCCSSQPDQAEYKHIKDGK